MVGIFKDAFPDLFVIQEIWDNLNSIISGNEKNNNNSTLILGQVKVEVFYSAIMRENTGVDEGCTEPHSFS